MFKYVECDNNIFYSLDKMKIPNLLFLYIKGREEFYSEGTEIIFNAIINRKFSN